MLVLSIVALCTGIVSAKPIEIRAMPGSITAGSDMHLDGFNFSALQYYIENAEGRCARYHPPSFADLMISSSSSIDPATALLVNTMPLPVLSLTEAAGWGELRLVMAGGTSPVNQIG